MGSFVYIKEIYPSSWLHWVYRGESSCLRDFERPEIRDYSTSQIKEYLHNEGNRCEEAPDRRVTGHENRICWRKEIESRNSRDCLIAEPSADQPKVAARMLDLFKTEVVPLLEQNQTDGLERAFVKWIERLHCIKTKTEFNHWDDHEVPPILRCKGAGWTATMLEFSRRTGSLNFIKTGGLEKAGVDTDFAVLAHVLKLGISSKKNLVQSGETDFVELDGLAMRPDGSCAVLEVKGPQDDASLFEATLQALLGALVHCHSSKLG
ncbi:MAG TPA: hypothetical protein VIM11_15600 [Tepidisphaeraceae bacterium]